MTHPALPLKTKTPLPLKTADQPATAATLKAHEIVAAFALLKGGKVDDGTGLYSPEAWKERGEEHGLGSHLVIVHDGGVMAPACNWDYQNYPRIEEFRLELEKHGLYVESCTCWYSAVYPIA